MPTSTESHRPGTGYLTVRGLTAGQVHLDGHDVTAASGNALTKGGLGYVPHYSVPEAHKSTAAGHAISDDYAEQAAWAPELLRDTGHRLALDGCVPGPEVSNEGGEFGGTFE
jgi:hypothetical protein